MARVIVLRLLGLAFWAALGTQAGAADLFAIHWDVGDLYRVSTDDAAMTRIGGDYQMSAIGSLELGPDGFLYGIRTASHELYRIDPATAAGQPVGDIGLEPVSEGALVMSPEGQMYGITGTGDLHQLLFTVDLTTAQTTPVALFTSQPHRDINGLAWRSDGMLIGLDRVTNALVILDPLNETITELATVSPTVGSIGGIAVVGGVGYFATSGPNPLYDPGSNELLSFDLYTGDHELVGSFAPTIDEGLGIGGLALPEPGTALALILGITLLPRRPRLRCRSAQSSASLRAW